MDKLQELYQKIEYLRDNGLKMKEIAEWVDMSPSVLSSLYTTVLPRYLESAHQLPSEDALDAAVALVNNVSKKRLLTHVEEMLIRLDEIELAEPDNMKDNPFARLLMEEVRMSASKSEAIKGIYTSYSLSSSSDRMKMEPFLIAPRENHIRIGRISAYGEAQWGVGIMPDPQNFHGLLNENQPPRFTMVTFYLQIPFFKSPRQLRGLYIGQDYNRNPVARRILLIKESESTEEAEFLKRTGTLLDKEELAAERQAYYDYTCQTGDYIKMCTVPSLRMDESDLVKEKKMLAL